MPGSTKQPSDRISLYRKLRENAERKVYLSRKLVLIGIITLPILNILWFKIDLWGWAYNVVSSPISLSISYIIIITVNLIVEVSRNAQTEEELIKYIINQFDKDAIDITDLDFLEDRSSESKSSSSTRVQLATILIPSYATFVGALIAVYFALNKSVPENLTLFMTGLLAILVQNLIGEVQRARFDSILLVSIKEYKRTLKM